MLSLTLCTESVAGTCTTQEVVDNEFHVSSSVLGSAPIHERFDTSFDETETWCLQMVRFSTSLGLFRPSTSSPGPIGGVRGLEDLRKILYWENAYLVHGSEIVPAGP